MEWNMTSRQISHLFAVCFLACGITVQGGDWPQWRGPQRDGIILESDIIDSIPKDGLPILWRTPIAGGYAGPAVVDGRVFVTDYVRTAGDNQNNPNLRVRLEGKERINCLSAKDGKILWTHEYDCPYEISYPAGPRCTPTVDNDRVYTLGAEGHLFCLDTKTGKVIWSKFFPKDFNTKSPIWGFSSHPLVYKDLLICVVGGDGSIAVAFDKLTGDVKWKALSAKEQGYAPPTIIHYAGRDHLIIWDAERMTGLVPDTGEQIWSTPLEAQYGMAIMAPLLVGNKIFASAIGPAGGLYEFDEAGTKLTRVWECTARQGVSSANSTPLIEDGVIYGTDCRSGGLRAVDLEKGTVLWETWEPISQTRRTNHGSVFFAKHNDRAIIFSETGDLTFAKLSREKYEELSRTHLIEPTGEAFGRPVVWSYPAFANSDCYIRNDKEIICVSLAKKK